MGAESRLSSSLIYSLPILRAVILLLICCLAFSVRLFAVIRFESVIHEFDPYFNFRTTKFLSKEGFYEWWNWFDNASWYPLGRVVGQTLYPGLMLTAYSMFKGLHLLGFTIDIRDICVFTAPIFSALTSLATYLLTAEATGRYGAALFAAVFVSLGPAYMSRSVAGSYDNEAVAIFALVFSFYTYVRALNRGTACSAMFSCLAYFYMVASWGGYVFITNTVAIHTLLLLLLGRITVKHYVVYSVWYILGTLMTLNIPFVNFQAITSSEHMSSHAVFLSIQALFLVQALRKHLPLAAIKPFLKTCLALFVVSLILVYLWLAASGRTRWAGRTMTLLDPTYAGKHVPIIASVSEHQPPTWSSYIFDLHLCNFLAPAGLWIAVSTSSDASLFLAVYGVLAAYFSCVMVRLMLVLCPASCVLAGLGLSYVLSCFTPTLHDIEAVFSGSSSVESSSTSEERVKPKKGTEDSDATLLSKVVVGIIVLTGLFYGTAAYVQHGVFASAMAYSHPSVILNSRLNDGTRYIQDDFREAYYWLRKNTHPDARIMSWWDYGYQSAAMSNRTVIVDNNTWNNTHIATVGLAFASTEEDAYPILLRLDVDYVFLLVGSYAGYDGDDLNKFLWMVRIANGVYPWIEESNYITERGELSVGEDASPHLRNSLIYKLAFHNFRNQRGENWDAVRKKNVITSNPLKHLESVYTTENWLVRIYKVKRPDIFIVKPNSIGISEAA